MNQLSEEQKRNMLLILSAGCDRETAARYVGSSPAGLSNAVARDEAFGAEVGRAEASAEFAHMRNVQQAARDEKHWRASVWWLERHAPERYGRRSPGAVTDRHLQEFLQTVANAVASGVRDEADRARVASALRRLIGRGDPAAAIGQSFAGLSDDDA